MANIRVKQKLEKIERELAEVANYTRLYGGISMKDARAILFRLEDIVGHAEKIYQDASGTDSSTYDVGFFRGR